MQENYPILTSCKPLVKPEFVHLNKIHITSDQFSIGRAQTNSVVIPVLSISRNHCIIKKSNNGEWNLEDNSSFGIEVNGKKIGKGSVRKLTNEDMIVFEPLNDLVYRFHDPDSETYEIPKKRIKLENDVQSDLIKVKFDESQNFEMKHMEEKIQNTKQMQTTSIILKQQLQLEMDRKMQQLEAGYAAQIQNLNGEKNEVERQKALLLEERDLQLNSLKTEMEGKISDLMEQIHKLNETESDLLQENNSLKEKLLRDREEFLAELNRESSSKQDLLDKLEERIREQEKVRQKEKQELEDRLRKETEQLRLAKEKELQELEQQKQQRELELQQELDSIKKNLEEQVERSKQQRLEAEQQISEQLEQMKKLTDEEKIKMEQLVKEREEIQKKLAEAEADANKIREQLTNKVSEKEMELAALAAERSQAEAQRSNEVIYSLQEQLEQVKSQLELVENEKQNLLESNCLAGEGTSKQAALDQVGEMMESELQCSICGELFIAATTLNCSHTFCKYCIAMWKRKKKDCPICRTPISSECKSLVLDSFIEKMVESLSEEMKTKRREFLTSREEQEAELARDSATAASRRRNSSVDDDDEYSDDEERWEEEEGLTPEDDDYDDSDDYHYYGRRRYLSSGSDSGSDSNTDYEASDTGADAAPDGAGANAAAPGAAAVPDNTAQRPDGDGARRRRRVPGLPGAYYGGYGRCFSCGARGHWAPGCPYR